MASLTIVLKNEETKHNNTVKHILTYNSDTVPRVGEYVQLAGQPTYEVVRIVHRPSTKSSIVIVEVKEVI